MTEKTVKMHEAPLKSWIEKILRDKITLFKLLD
jgi:hypothetical protein